MTLQQLKIALLGYVPDMSDIDRLPPEQALVHVHQMNATRPPLLMYLMPLATVFMPVLLEPGLAHLAANETPGHADGPLAFLIRNLDPICWVAAGSQMLVMIPLILQRQRARAILRALGLPLYPDNA